MPMPLNRNSVYTKCFDCHMIGINMPGNDKRCGNCLSENTKKYICVEDALHILEHAIFAHGACGLTDSIKQVVADRLAEL